MKLSNLRSCLLSTFVGISNTFANCKRSKTSQTWLNRHVKDQYVKKSIQNDLRSRSAYKLKEIQEKYNLISSPSNYVIDMGAAPGGWTIVASNYLNHRGLLISIDLLPIDSIVTHDTNIHILQGDMFAPNINTDIHNIAFNHYAQLHLKATAFPTSNEELLINNASINRSIHLADVIMSDMMVNMCGNKEIDHYRSIDLCYQALYFTEKYLKINGNFLCKYFRGKDEKEFLDELRKRFQQVKVMKPDASRKESSEMYVVAIRKKDSLK